VAPDCTIGEYTVTMGLPPVLRRISFTDEQKLEIEWMCAGVAHG
jgi:hypothetical protein